MHAAIPCLALFTLVRAASAECTVHLVPLPASKALVVQVRGIDAANLDKLGRLTWQAEQWNKLLSVKPLRGTAQEQKQRPAMLGNYRVAKEGVVFEPRFPLQAGTKYEAVVDLAALPEPRPGQAIKTILAIPALPEGPATAVSRIYPTCAQLPKNVLKFYIHFSAPMSQGRVYQHFKLLDDKDKVIAWPWLELDEELWNPDGTRFTLFFDPGRIKQGLKPREDLGPALQKGKKYTLVIDGGWTDANNRPLQASYRKTFTVAEPIDKCAAMEKWKITPGQAGTRQPLEVVLPAPMDSALLQRLVWVVDGKGKRMAGTIALDREESVWRFTPAEAWQAGEYQLAADNCLEDLAGNSLGKPFEVDVLRPIEKEVKPEVLKRRFAIK